MLFCGIQLTLVLRSPITLMLEDHLAIEPVSMQSTPAPHYNGRSDAMMPIEVAIIEKLRRSGPLYLDEVVLYLPNFSWGEIFIAVDRMSRDGRLLLRKRGCSDYQIALDSQSAHLTSATN